MGAHISKTDKKGKSSRIMDYNALALGIDLVTRSMDKRNLASLFEIAQNASCVDYPELFIAYFAFLISKHLPADQTDEERVDFFRRTIETLAVEADSEINLSIETCVRCGRPYLTPAGRRLRHQCSANGYQV